MSDLNVTERRLRPIQDAVASKNWKQALQQCEKWQKKGEKSDRFLALKASILINQPDKSQIEKGKAETLQLCHRSPAVTDIEALYQLQNSLRKLSLLQDEGSKLWERAIAARPNDKDLLTTLLNGSVSDDNWMSAQKAAMALRKAFSKDRQYDFWNMLLCYLINQDETLPQKDRDLFGRLAFMLVSRAAESVPANKEELLVSGKAIATIEELSLLTKIYIATGHVAEAMDVLQSPNLGLQSRLAEQDPYFAFSLLLDALGASQNHDRVFEICQQFLSPNSPVYKQYLEDDRIWKIVKSISNTQAASRDRTDACQNFAQSVYEAEPTCRAAYLTFFDIVIQRLIHDGQNDSDLLASACTQYYEVFSEKPFCFNDLARPLHLAGSSRNVFRSNVKLDDGTMMQQVFALKLMRACLGLEGEPGTDADYLKIATDALRLFKKLPKEKPECPEVVLLAAMTLLELASRTQNSNIAIQANYMMENCYLKFNEYFPLTVRQVQLHLAQGQVTLAMKKFASLAVKNMQWETLGHLLLTRIATIHPWSSGSDDNSLNPLAALDAGLMMLENADHSLDRAIHEGLRYNSYSNVIDSINVRGSMARSMNRQIFLVEERRIQRLVGVPVDIELNPYPAKMVDQRDFSFLPTFGDVEETSNLEESLACGPLPREYWLRAMALHDHLVSYLKSELQSHANLAATTFSHLQSVLDKCKRSEGAGLLQLTEDENSSLRCHQAIVEAICLNKSGSAAVQKEFDGLVNDVVTWIDKAVQKNTTGIVAVNGVDTPTWKFLHTSFTQLETLQTICFFLSLQARRTKSSKADKAVLIAKDKILTYQEKVSSAEKAIHERVKEVKDRLGSSGVLGKLVDAAAGRIEDSGDQLTDSEEYKALTAEYADLVDEVVLEEFCGSMKDSWEDALDGVLKVKIRTLK